MTSAGNRRTTTKSVLGIGRSKMTARDITMAIHRRRTRLAPARVVLSRYAKRPSANSGRHRTTGSANREAWMSMRVSCVSLSPQDCGSAHSTAMTATQPAATVHAHNARRNRHGTSITGNKSYAANSALIDHAGASKLPANPQDWTIRTLKTNVLTIGVVSKPSR